MKPRIRAIIIYLYMYLLMMHYLSPCSLMLKVSVLAKLHHKQLYDDECGANLGGF